MVLITRRKRVVVHVERRAEVADVHVLRERKKSPQLDLEAKPDGDSELPTGRDCPPPPPPSSRLPRN
jgi:hypothetical protein